jgi:hypothetical protein
LRVVAKKLISINFIGYMIATFQFIDYGTTTTYPKEGDNGHIRTLEET